MSDPDKTQELPACAPERQAGWSPTPTNPKTPPPRRYRKNTDPLTRPALRFGDVEVCEPEPKPEQEPDAVELHRNKSASEDASVEAWFRAGMFFFVAVILPILLAWKWGE